MKYLVGFCRIVVGGLFVISGLIKLNDPIGLSFKLEEYFSIGVLDIPFLIPYALALVVFMVVVEVLLGVMLLLGFKVKFTLWGLMLMIIFFAFLTFYSAYFNKVTDCGCFGDAVKLAPWESFTKDIILLVLVVVLFLGIKHIKAIFGRKVAGIGIAIVLVASALFANYVLNHLPLVDFRPYKIGANIEKGMSTPSNAPKTIYKYKWRFKVAGKDLIIVTNGGYPTVDGEFIDVETTEIQKGYIPPIHDFSIEKNGEDMASIMLQEEKLVIIVAYDLAKSNYDYFDKIKDVTDKAVQKGYKVIGMSASKVELTTELIEKYNFNFEFYFNDETTLKTITRSNPSLLVLERGTIKQKLHYNDLNDIGLD